MQVGKKRRGKDGGPGFERIRTEWQEEEWLASILAIYMSASDAQFLAVASTMKGSA